MDAIFGHTGFVGGNLTRQHDFGARFNSRTASEAVGHRFETVACAAAPGSMLDANRDPEGDSERIDALIAVLDRIEARQFALLSTIAVLDGFGAGQDETTEAFEATLAYGRNRRRLEAFCAGRFEQCLILRLPALFGAGLKKNFLFDLCNPAPAMLTASAWDNLGATLAPSEMALAQAVYSIEDGGIRRLDRARLAAMPEAALFEAALMRTGLGAVRFTNPESRFQFYGMDRLWSDVERGFAAGVPVLHLAPEPVAADAVHRLVAGRAMPDAGARVHREDMRTRHSELWGAETPYSRSADEVLADLRGFFGLSAPEFRS